MVHDSLYIHVFFIIFLSLFLFLEQSHWNCGALTTTKLSNYFVQHSLIIVFFIFLNNKVMIASSKREGSVRDPKEDEKLLRLFVIIPKSFTKDDLRKEFEV